MICETAGYGITVCYTVTYILPVGLNEDSKFHFILFSELKWTRDIAAQVTVLQWIVNA